MDTLHIPNVIRDSAPAADGFVVVSIWTPGRYTSTRHTYDFFDTLPEALAHHVAICDGRVRDYEPNGIFAARNGLPVGGPLDLETMRSVEPGPWKRLWDGARSTPENKMLKELSLRDAANPNALKSIQGIARAALSVEGEDELARGQGRSAPASNFNDSTTR